MAASLVAAALTATLVGGGPATADLRDDKRKLESKISSLEEDMDHTSADLAAANRALQDSQSRLPAARDAVTAALAAQAAAEQRNEQAKADLAVARADEAKAVAELARTRDELADTRSAVAGFAAQLYTEQGTGTLAIALEAADPQVLVDRMSMTEVLADIQNTTLSELNTSNASLMADQDFLGATRAKVAAAQAATEAALAQAKDAAAAATAAQAALDALIAQQEAASATLEAQKAAERKRHADLTAESDRIAATLRVIAEAERKKAEEERKKAEQEAANNQGSGGSGSPAPSPSNPPASGAFLSAPVRSGYVSSEFGWRMHPILHNLRLHSGRDYAAACGTPVYAAAPGTVVSLGWAGGYGNQVIISHGLVGGQSLATTYNHLTSFATGSGSIARGALVGYVGTTGLSTGCHLHFEARVNGVPKDPRIWL